MAGISKAITRALQLGIKKVLEPNFTCYQLENASQPDTQSVGYRCVWPSTKSKSGAPKKALNRFGKLQYISTFQWQNSSRPQTVVARTNYFIWEGKMERGRKVARAYDTDLDGKLNIIFVRSEANTKFLTTFLYENGTWYRDPLEQKERVSAYELTEMILPAQDAYTNTLILGGLLLLSPKLEIKELF